MRRHFPFIVVLAALAVVYLWLNWCDELGSLHGDGIIYFLTAMQYAPYWPHDPLAEGIASASQFPPVYSFLLMLFGGGASFLAAHLATTVFLLACFAAFYAWLLALGLQPALACASATAFAIMPGTFLQSFYLHPEGLYVALVLLSLLWIEVGERSGKANYFWAASAMIGIAFVTRTAGVTLLPALAVVLLRRRPRGWPLMLALAAAPAGLWSLVHHPVTAYSEALVSKYGHGDALQATADDIGRLIQTVGEGLAWNAVFMDRLMAVSIAFGAIAMPVAAWRFIKLKADAWHLGAYLGVLAVWPFPQEAWRLTWVVVPIMLGYFFWIGELAYVHLPQLSARIRSALRFAPVLAFAIVVVPEFALRISRAEKAVALGEPELRHFPEWYDPNIYLAHRLVTSSRGAIEALREFAPQIPEGECLYSTMPYHTAYITDRNTSYAPQESRSDGAFDDDLRRSGCRYFVMFGIPTSYAVDFYPRDRLGSRLRIVAVHQLDGKPLALLGLLVPSANPGP